MLSKFFKKRRKFDYLMYCLVIAAGIIIDQVTKLIAVRYLEPIGSVPVIKFGDTEVFNFTYVENPGAAFGMLADAPWVFNTVSIIGIIVMSLYLFLGHADSALAGFALSMVISGGIGNMIDRLVLHYVVDFLHFSLIDFAVFNGADSFVCVGAGLLVLAIVLEMIEEYKSSKNGRGTPQA